jgi:hypothetical protein
LVAVFDGLNESILTPRITIMHAKTLLVLVAIAIVVYVFTRSRENMCAATPKLTADAIKKACEDMHGVYDATTNTCSCPGGVV